jgi:hypothetical protein
MRSTASIAETNTVSTQVERANPTRDWGDGRYAASEPTGTSPKFAARTRAALRIPSHSVHPFRSNPYADSDVFVHPVRRSPLALA